MAFPCRVNVNGNIRETNSLAALRYIMRRARHGVTTEFSPLHGVSGVLAVACPFGYPRIDSAISVRVYANDKHYRGEYNTETGAARIHRVLMGRAGGRIDRMTWGEVEQLA
jgi:hypothetical protein